MHRLSFMRCDAPAVRKRGGTIELAVPVIDGVRLSERLGGRFPGIAMKLLVLPSNHWSGVPEYVEEERPVILDGGCGIAGCCGVMARIELTPTAVVWADFFARGRPQLPDRLCFEFDRQQYILAIAALPDVPAMPSGGVEPGR
ncbi:MAG: hypothetical protein M3256_05500 [Actinomycetota bacterium]|nr:hypothetical protein [Actinomycetota bacterium]